MLISCRKVIYATVTPSVFPKNQTANRYWEPQKTGEELYQAYFDMSSNRSIDPLAKQDLPEVIVMHRVFSQIS